MTSHWVTKGLKKLAALGDLRRRSTWALSVEGSRSLDAAARRWSSGSGGAPVSMKESREAMAYWAIVLFLSAGDARKREGPERRTA